jgi:hypothetical protein
MKNPTSAKKKREKRCERVINREVIQKDGLNGIFNDIVLIGEFVKSGGLLFQSHMFSLTFTPSSEINRV